MRPFHLFALVLALTAAVAAPPALAQDDLSEEVAQLRTEVEAIKGELVQMKQLLIAVATELYKRGPSLPESVELGTGPMLGHGGAKVGIIEFTDFECPFCGRYRAETFPRLKREFMDRGVVQYYTRDFPLPAHPRARDAAVAARCANAQGKGWEMQAKLFENQRTLSWVRYIALAGELGLDRARFEACMNDPAPAAKVEADAALGQTLGVDGTPYFLIGVVESGRLTGLQALTGAQPFERFAQIIGALSGS